ncbi:MAG: ribonuclease III [Oscillospiraceae bacterium]|nr:ribonuclease III [Oscillospiraceae bacterium]MBQ8378869.1 ribonuclease III [Oscillospiraceae bacterium]
MSFNVDFSEFERKIGYTFKNKGILYEALSHSSFANETKKNSNERLEFLGDSVLSIVVSNYLFEHYQHLPEGHLTKVRSSLVCENSLYEFAKTIDLGDYIMLGKGEENTGGRKRPSILADAFEAVIAAVYLDGGIENASKYVLSFIPKDLSLKKAVSNNDYKTILQEVIQKNPEEKVEYFLKSAVGPDHDKTFTIQVKLNSNVIGEGTGHSKKQAEQAAAKEALKLMGYET